MRASQREQESERARKQEKERDRERESESAHARERDRERERERERERKRERMSKEGRRGSKPVKEENISAMAPICSRVGGLGLRVEGSGFRV